MCLSDSLHSSRKDRRSAQERTKASQTSPYFQTVSQLKWLFSHITRYLFLHAQRMSHHFAENLFHPQCCQNRCLPIPTNRFSSSLWLRSRWRRWWVVCLSRFLVLQMPQNRNWSTRLPFNQLCRFWSVVEFVTLKTFLTLQRPWWCFGRSQRRIPHWCRRSCIYGRCFWYIPH